MKHANNAHPTLLAFPLLPLKKALTFGPWWLGPTEQFEGPWFSPEFEARARRFLSAFRDSSGQPITGGALLARTDTGADGQPPNGGESTALELAVGFATIDQNPYWSPTTSTTAWNVATTDNAAMWIQPLNITEGWIALGRGSRVSITCGGRSLNNDDFTIPTPLELHMPFTVTLDAEAVGAIYDILTTPPAHHQEDASRVRVAVRWLLRSWQNTPSITWEDRLVFLKVATEALTGVESTVVSGRQIEALFERASAQEGSGIGTDDLLWRAGKPHLVRSWKTRAGSVKNESVSAFVHWFAALGDARNALVHGEDAVPLDYREAGSPYNGPFVEMGDRVMREAILVLLGECGYPAVWRRGLARASFHALRHLTKVSEEEGGEGAETSS